MPVSVLMGSISWSDIVLTCCAVVWNIQREEEVFQIKGFDFVFIYCGHNEGRITSMDWIDEDENVIQTVTLTVSESQLQVGIRPTTLYQC